MLIWHTDQNKCIVITSSFTKLPWPGKNEGTFCVKLQSKLLCTIHGRAEASRYIFLMLNVKQESGEIIYFYCLWFDSTWNQIQSTISVADATSTRPTLRNQAVVTEEICGLN